MAERRGGLTVRIFSTGCIIRAPERQSARAPERQSARAPERQSARAPERQSARAPERQSARAPERQSARAPERQSARAPERQSARAPERQSARAPERQSARAPERQSARAPERQSARAPERLPRHPHAGTMPFRTSLAQRAADAMGRAPSAGSVQAAGRPPERHGRLSVGPPPCGGPRVTPLLLRLLLPRLPPRSASPAAWRAGACALAAAVRPAAARRRGGRGADPDLEETGRQPSEGCARGRGSSTRTMPRSSGRAAMPRATLCDRRGPPNAPPQWDAAHLQREHPLGFERHVRAPNSLR